MIVELTCFLYDSARSELMGKEVSEIPARFILNTADIESVREVCDIDSDEISNDRCYVRTKSGDSLEAGCSYKWLVAKIKQWFANCDMR